MNRAARVSSHLRGSVGILRISGNVTDEAETSILRIFEELAAQGSRKILLVFHEKTFINSGGIRVLLTLVFKAAAAKQPVRAAGLSKHMEYVFDLVGLKQLMTISASESQALQGW